MVHGSEWVSTIIYRYEYEYGEFKFAKLFAMNENKMRDSWYGIALTLPWSGTSRRRPARICCTPSRSRGSTNSWAPRSRWKRARSVWSAKGLGGTDCSPTSTDRWPPPDTPCCSSRGRALRCAKTWQGLGLGISLSWLLSICELTHIAWQIYCNWSWADSHNPLSWSETWCSSHPS